MLQELRRSSIYPKPGMWPYILIAIVGTLFCWFWVQYEKVFYFWDTSAYYDNVLYVAHLFHTSLLSGIRYVVKSMNEDYNALFTLPLLPFRLVFGKARAAYIAANFLLYLFPLSVIAGLITGLIFPAQKSTARLVGCLMMLCMPNCWFPVLRGYPDSGGAVFLSAAVWLYLARNALDKRRDPFILGALLALSILFRRHYVYGVATIVFAIFVDLWLRYKLDGDGDLKTMYRRYVNLSKSLAVCALLLAVLASQFVWRSLQSARGGYPSAYAAYQLVSSLSWREIAHNQGPLLLILAGMGWVVLLLSKSTRKAPARLILLAAIVWLAVWTKVVRQESTHYPHVLPLALAIGLTSLLLSAGSLANPIYRRVSVAAVAALIGAHLLYVTTTIGPVVAAGQYLPDSLQPTLARPMVNPEYQTIVNLITYLREHCSPNDKIIVAASSGLLNPSLLDHADLALSGKDHTPLNILNTPQVDGRDPLPTAQLLDSDVAVIVQPFQQHLGERNQKVVLALFKPFTEGWPIAGDFRLEERMPLNSIPGGNITIFRRIRPSNPQVSADTCKRISQLMQGK